jgi:hypothetical protein
MKWSRKYSPLLLGMWLIAFGLMALVPPLRFLANIVPVLAVVAGIAILMDR